MPDFKFSKSKKYEIKAIKNSKVYIKELKIDLLLKFYYFIF